MRKSNLAKLKHHIKNNPDDEVALNSVLGRLHTHIETHPNDVSNLIDGLLSNNHYLQKSIRKMRRTMQSMAEKIKSLQTTSEPVNLYKDECVCGETVMRMMASQVRPWCDSCLEEAKNEISNLKNRLRYTCSLLQKTVDCLDSGDDVDPDTYVRILSALDRFERKDLRSFLQHQIEADIKSGMRNKLPHMIEKNRKFDKIRNAT